MGSQSRARSERKSRELTDESMYLLVRGLIMDLTSNMAQSQALLDALVSFSAPVEGWETSASKRNARHHEVTAHLKATEQGEHADWSVRDGVFEAITGTLREHRNFWAHAHHVRRDGEVYLVMVNSSAYPDGLRLVDAPAVGLAFLGELAPHRDYVGAQYANVRAYLERELALPRE